MPANQLRSDDLADVVATVLAEDPVLRSEAGELLAKTMRMVYGYVAEQFGPFGTPSTKLALAKTLLPAFLKGTKSQQESESTREIRETQARIIAMARSRAAARARPSSSAG